MSAEIKYLLEKAQECDHNVRLFTRKIIRDVGFEEMAYYYNNYVYETFMDNFDNNVCQNNGKRYTTDDEDKYICAIDDLTDYYETVIKLLEYNQLCKHQIEVKAKSTAFFILKQQYSVPHDLRNVIKKFL